MGKRIFFAGSYFQEGGPWEVNSNLVSYLDKDIHYLTHSFKPLRLLEYFYNILICKVIVFSGITSIDQFLIPFATFLGRKIVYIMHGCLELEYRTNNYVGNMRALWNEKMMLKNASLILCVSYRYRDFLMSQYPQYAHKMNVLVNGINWDKYAFYGRTKIFRKDNNKIILMGGGRVTKRNLQVCQAIDKLNSEDNTSYYVEVYGKYLENDDSVKIQQCKCVKKFNLVPHQKMMQYLAETRLFVQSSEFESFSLGVVEALMCGADILVSKNVGALDIIPAANDMDIINDVFNVDEIKLKLRYVLKHPNNSRLISSIDKNDTSAQSSAKKLSEILKSL